MPIASPTGETLTRTTSLPAISPFTVMFWHRLDAAPDSFATFWKFGGAAGPGGYRIGYNPGGTLPFTIRSEGHTSVTGTAMALGTYYHLALAVSGTGAGQALGYLNGVLDVTQNGNSVTPEEMCVAWWGGASGENSQGSRAAYKFYTRALSAAEIATEMRYYLPVSTDGLTTWCPWRDVAETATNYGSDAIDWTVGGTFTLTDGPPIAWEPPRGHARRAAAAPAFVGDESGLWYLPTEMLL